MVVVFDWAVSETSEFVLSDLIHAAQLGLICPEEFRKNAVKLQNSDCMHGVACGHCWLQHKGSFGRAGALGSLSFVPVIEKQVFNPVEEYRILSIKASVIHSPSNEAKTYGSFFFSERDDRWYVRESPIFEVW